MFDGFVGQETARERLARRVRRRAGSRAFLLTGERGLGKRSFAREFARALLCVDGSIGGDIGDVGDDIGGAGCVDCFGCFGCFGCVDGDGRRTAPCGDAKNGRTSSKPCGVCAPCRMFDAGLSDDFLLVDPAPDKVVSVDDIRDVTNWIALRPMISRAKVCVIVDANRMTTQAQNALLKTLEEPPDYALIALTASRADALTDTVRSRCENVKFARYSESQVMSILVSRGIAEDIASLGARLSGGAPGRVGWGDSIDEYIESRDRIFNNLANMVAGDWGAPVELAESLEKSRDAFMNDTEVMVEILRDAWFVAARARAGQPRVLDVGTSPVSGFDGLLRNADLSDGFETFAAGLDSREVLRAASDIAAIRDAVSKNANLPLAADALVTKLSKLATAEKGLIYGDNNRRAF